MRMMENLQLANSPAVISTTNWVITISALLIIIALDFAWAVSRRHKDTTMKEATLWSLFYVSLAILFGLNLSQWLGAQEQHQLLFFPFNLQAGQNNQEDKEIVDR